jgi:hypothetical protein
VAAYEMKQKGEEKEGAVAFYDPNVATLKDSPGSWEILVDVDERKVTPLDTAVSLRPSKENQMLAWRWDRRQGAAEYKVITTSDITHFELMNRSEHITAETRKDVERVLQAESKRQVGGIPLREMFLQHGIRNEMILDMYGDMKLDVLCKDLKKLEIRDCGLWHEDKRLDPVNCFMGVNNLTCGHIGNSHRQVMGAMEDAMMILGMLRRVSPDELRKWSNQMKEHMEILTRVDSEAQDKYVPEMRVEKEQRGNTRQYVSVDPAEDDTPAKPSKNGRTPLQVISQGLRQKQRIVGKPILKLCDTLLGRLELLAQTPMSAIGRLSLLPCIRFDYSYPRSNEKHFDDYVHEAGRPYLRKDLLRKMIIRPEEEFGPFDARSAQEAA